MKTKKNNYELQIHNLSRRKDTIKVEYSLVDDHGEVSVERKMSTEPLLNWINDNVDFGDESTNADDYLSDNLFLVLKNYLNENY